MRYARIRRADNKFPYVQTTKLMYSSVSRIVWAYSLAHARSEYGGRSREGLTTVTVRRATVDDMPAVTS